MATPTDETPTMRGPWRIYAEFKDVDGQTVTVETNTSRSDDRSLTWIACSDGTDRQHTVPSPHLTVAQARRVRDALDRFIKDHTGHDPR
jgi:hypothetical protein